MVAPGRVQQRGEARLAGADVQAGAALARLFEGTGAGVDPTADFTTETWRKLAVNAVAGLMAVTRRRTEVFRGDGLRPVATALARECVAVARAGRRPRRGRRRGGRGPPRVVPAGPRHVDPLRPPRRPADGVGRAQRRRLPSGPGARDRDAGQRRARPAARPRSTRRRRSPRARGAGYSSRRRTQSSPSASSRPFGARSSSW